MGGIAKRVIYRRVENHAVIRLAKRLVQVVNGGDGTVCERDPISLYINVMAPVLPGHNSVIESVMGIAVAIRPVLCNFDKGFADELIEDAEPTSIAASADGRSLFVNGRQMHLAPGMFAPDNIPTVTPEASAPVETDKNKPEVTGDEGGISMTKEELRAKYPDEIAQVEADARASVDHTEAVNTAIQAERARMQEIDEISGLLDATDVQQAKYGDKPCSAADLLMAAAKNAAKQGKKFLTDLKDDSEESGAEGVPAAPAPAVETPEGEDGEKNDTPEARMTNARSMVADLLGKKKEG